MVDLDIGISDIDCFHGMMKEFGWIEKLGIVLLQKA